MNQNIKQTNKWHYNIAILLVLSSFLPTSFTYGAETSQATAEQSNSKSTKDFSPKEKEEYPDFSYSAAANSVMNKVPLGSEMKAILGFDELLGSCDDIKFHFESIEKKIRDYRANGEHAEANEIIRKTLFDNKNNPVVQQKKNWFENELSSSEKSIFLEKKYKDMQKQVYVCKAAPVIIGGGAFATLWSNFNSYRTDRSKRLLNEATANEKNAIARQNDPTAGGMFSHNYIMKVMSEISETISPENSPKPEDLLYNTRTKDRLGYMRSQHLRNAKSGNGLHNILLYGPAGTGKSGFGESFSHSTEFDVVKIPGSKIDREQTFNMLMYYVKTLAGIDPMPEKDPYWKKFKKVTSKAWHKVRRTTEQESRKKIIVIIDEAEPFFKALNGLSKSSENLKNSFLTNIGAHPRYSFIFTTNRVWELESSADKAVFRRLHKQFLVDLPNAETRMELIRSFTKKYVAKSYPGLDTQKLLEEVFFGENSEEFVKEFNQGMTSISADELRPISQTLIEAVAQNLGSGDQDHQLDVANIDYVEAAKIYQKVALEDIGDREEGDRWRKREEEEEAQREYKKLEARARLEKIRAEAQASFYQKAGIDPNAAAARPQQAGANQGFGGYPQGPATGYPGQGSMTGGWGY